MGIFSTLERRTSAHPRAETAWLLNALGGREVSSGMRVTPDTALEVSAVFRAVTLISQTLALLPTIVYRFLARGKERDVSHPVSRLLRVQPNRYQTAFQWKEMMEGHVCLRGNAYSQIVTNAAGVIEQLLPLHPDRTKPLQENGQYVTVGGELVYEYRSALGGAPQIFFQSEILHFRGFSRDGVVGVSPITLAREAVGLSMAIEQQQARFYGNGATLSGALKVPRGLNREQRQELRESFIERHAGVERAHSVAVFEDGMEWQQIGLSAKDAETLAERKFQVTEIARWYGVPPHKIGDLERATFTNIEHQAIEWVTDAILPRARRNEQTLMMALFTPTEQQTHFIEYLIEALLRGDTKSRFEAYAIGRQWGWLSADDVRELENMNPLPEGRGDIYLTPLNMIPAEMAGEDAGEDARGRRPQLLLLRARVEQAHRTAVQDGIRRALRRETLALTRRAKHVTAPDTRDAFLAWAAIFYREHGPTMVRDVLPAAEGYVGTLAELTGLAPVDLALTARTVVHAWVADELHDALRDVTALVGQEDPAEAIAAFAEARTDDPLPLLRLLGEAITRPRGLPAAA